MAETHSETNQRKIVVLDDDPTGIQTVHGCYVLTRWDPGSIRTALQDSLPFFYVLTNTRARTAEEAGRVIAEIMSSVLQVNEPLGHRLLFVSRSDSTLRSHFPLEVDTIAAHLQREGGGPADAVFVVPAFIEGGRITDGDTHYLLEDGRRVPTSDTEFARDSVFGYATSHLPSYIEEKTGGRVGAADVVSLPCELLEPGHDSELRDLIFSLDAGRYVVVNATGYRHLEVFSKAIRHAAADGKRFIFQSAASLVKTLAEVPDRPLLRAEILRPEGRGLVVVGSHVRKSSVQLEHMTALPNVVAVEVDVSPVVRGETSVLSRVIDALERAWGESKTPVVYTSRNELHFANSSERLHAGSLISQFLVDIVKLCPVPLSWLVSKGGITSHDLLVDGLGVRMARVLGQVLPGVPVVLTGPECRWPGIPYVIFPGNVGDERTLCDVYAVLTGTTGSA